MESVLYQEWTKEAKEEGKIEGKIEVARTMIKDGLNNNIIANYTGLSVDKTSELRTQITN